jgi:hypothetical protein
MLEQSFLCGRVQHHFFCRPVDTEILICSVSAAIFLKCADQYPCKEKKNEYNQIKEQGYKHLLHKYWKYMKEEQ